MFKCDLCGQIVEGGKAIGIEQMNRHFRVRPGDVAEKHLCLMCVNCIINQKDEIRKLTEG